ncbi:MAG: hypothetical protein PHW04_05170 [Candidatus Wallbacteria bacterium]|nr:hypothetical protein [Candidatus Wallbacteria bacterium]
MKKGILIIGFLVTLTFSQATAGGLENFNNLIENYWQAKNGCEQAYDKACAAADLIAGNITARLDLNDASLFQEFVSYYKNTTASAPELREALNLVADRVVEYRKSSKATAGKDNEDFTPDTVFPGYGYPDPAYSYKIGSEQNREILQEVIKSTVKCFSIGLSYTVLVREGVEFNPADYMRVQKVGSETVSVDNGQERMDRYAVTFTKSIQITCKTRVLKVKVWSKLFRAKKGWFGSLGQWEECGKTYQIQDDAQYFME